MGLIGLLAAALIICFMAFASFKTYFKTVKEHPIDTTTTQSTVTSMKSQLKAASQTEIDHTKEMEGMK